MWPPVREAYKWVKRVSRVLKNEEELQPAGPGVGPVGADASGGGNGREPLVRDGLRHFLKVSKSYWPGLFRCYESSELPRTNNDLEHTFGSHRYHERRASGRRRASPGLVVMGSARLVSGLATRLRPEEGLSCRRAMWCVGKSYEGSWRDAESREATTLSP